MSDHAPESARLALTDNDDVLGRIEVDIEAYFDFHFQLAEELEDLVAIWRHRHGVKPRPSAAWNNDAIRNP